MSEKLYKLRRPSDGLFFSGSGYRKKTWTKNGKSYNSIAMAKNALGTAVRQAPETGGWDTRITMEDIEIVEYEINEIRTLTPTGEPKENK